MGLECPGDEGKEEMGKVLRKGKKKDAKDRVCCLLYFCHSCIWLVLKSTYYLLMFLLNTETKNVKAFIIIPNKWE